MILYCKNCKKKVEVKSEINLVTKIAICPLCSSNIGIATDADYSKTLLVQDDEDHAKGFHQVKKIITFLSILLLLLGCVFAVLLFYPKTAPYTRDSLKDIYGRTRSFITGVPYIKEAARDFFLQGEEAYRGYTYASLKEANINYQRSYQTDENFLDARIAEAETYALLGGISNDERLMRKALILLTKHKDTVHSRARFLRAHVLAEIGNVRIHFYTNSSPLDEEIHNVYKNALAMIEEAITLEPANPFNYNVKGTILLLNQKADEEALLLFKKANELDRKFLEPLFNIALLFYFTQNFEKAIEYADLILEFNPALEWAHSLKEIIHNEALEETVTKNKARSKVVVEEISYSNDLAFDYITSYRVVRKYISERNIL